MSPLAQSAKWERGYQSLASRIQTYFPRPLVIVDALNKRYVYEMVDGLSRSRSLDLVLTGGFLARLLGNQHWPDGKFRIWVACTRARAVIEAICGAKPGEVGVLPRYRLFPLETPLREFSSVSTLVYGGRLTPMKGLWHLLEVSSLLQTVHGLNLSLSLHGEWAGSYKGYFSASAIGADVIEERTNRLIRSLDWDQSPTLHHGQGSERWLQTKSSNPAVVSLSRLSHEDFGVSVAQAQSLGWPSLLSSWGAHFDAALPNTLFAPSFDLYADPRARSRECARLAADIARQIKRRPSGAMKPKKIAMPRALESVKIVDRSVLLRWATTADHRFPGIVESATTRGLADFGRSASGEAFVARYEKIFSRSGGR